MNWRRKAVVLNTIDRLPPRLSCLSYRLVERKLGGRRVKLASRLASMATIIDQIHKQGYTVESKSFLEIGTGRHIDLPIALWLCGASTVVTTDLYPYLSPQLVSEDLRYLRSNQGEIRAVLRRCRDNPLFEQRLTQVVTPGMSLSELLEVTHTQYLAPADASSLDLPSHCVDYHVSHAVLEHIPPLALRKVLQEGKRLVKANGLLVHVIDLSDHFSHTDSSVSAINFLQLDQDTWTRCANSRYTYHNRLRIDDYMNLFKEVGLHIVSLVSEVDERALDELRGGFVVNSSFRGKSPAINATVSIRVVASPDH